MRARPTARLLPVAFVGLASLGSFGCKNGDETAKPEPAPTVLASAPSPSGSGARAEAPPPPPTLGFVPTKIAGLDEPASIFAVDEGVLVATEYRVGRIGDGKVEWLGEIPKDNAALGPNSIRWVGGHAPDSIDVLYSNLNGRAPMPTYVSLTGKGGEATFSEGGGSGWIAGVARVGESTVITGSSMFEGYPIATVRGPRLTRVATTPTKAGCKPEEAAMDSIFPGRPAVVPYVFGGTRAGTLIAFGPLCGEGGPAAEVWDAKTGEAKIHKLGEWFESAGFGDEILQGDGDVAWIAGGEKDPILEYRDGKFSSLPALGKPLFNAFVGDDKALYAIAGETLFRFDGKAWTTVAHFAWSTSFARGIARRDGVYWVSDGTDIGNLRPTEGVAYREGCTTPFVLLYDVSPISEPNYTFPTTRKALASFDRVKEVELVDFLEGKRRLGAKVPSGEVGQALIAHVRANMKDEDPKLLCYAPTKPRKIDIAGGR